MTELDRVVAIKRKAEARFLVLPGVHGVGLGPKLVDGKSAGELAIKVYLADKRSPDSLRPGEVVPAEAEEVKTDVVQIRRPAVHVDNVKEQSWRLIGLSFSEIVERIGGNLERCRTHG